MPSRTRGTATPFGHATRKAVWQRSLPVQVVDMGEAHPEQVTRTGGGSEPIVPRLGADSLTEMARQGSVVDGARAVFAAIW